MNNAKKATTKNVSEPDYVSKVYCVRTAGARLQSRIRKLLVRPQLGGGPDLLDYKWC